MIHSRWLLGDSSDAPCRCLIISGLPGSGKTTVSQLLAAHFPYSARVDGDMLHRITIVKGEVSPESEPAEEAERQLQLRFRNIASLTDNLVEAGFMTVVDQLVKGRERWHFLLDHLRTRPVLLITLTPPLHVAQYRNQTRDPDQRVHFDFGFLEGPMRAELGDVGWWLDNSVMTAAKTASEIVEKAPKHALTWD